MTLQERREAVQARAEQLQAGITQRRNEIEQLQADLYRCDGQFRMLTEILTAEAALPVPDAAPVPTPDTTTDAGAPAKEIPS